ncbi:MAG: maleylpyruvate isomerase family mycothiol-dependent enzyme [Marmoricola sp.]
MSTPSTQPAAFGFEEHGHGIGDAWTVMREHANRVGPDGEVVTCPGWRVRHLVAHQGTIHRWATAHIRGETDVDTGELERQGMAAADQLAWLDAGARDLLQALRDAPDDLAAFFFLKNAPPPKFAWARRQCHETTIHAVDAMSASLGRPPRAAETWIRPRLAADGIDELLTGFVPRRHEQVRSPEPRTVVVQADDTGDAWTLAIGPDPVVTAREGASGADTVLTGTAAQLYLGLWNRGDEVVTSGSGFLDEWRRQMHVEWG